MLVQFTEKAVEKTHGWQGIHIKVKVPEKMPLFYMRFSVYITLTYWQVWFFLVTLKFSLLTILIISYISISQTVRQIASWVVWHCQILSCASYLPVNLIKLCVKILIMSFPHKPYCHVLSDCRWGLDWQLDLLDHNTVTVYTQLNTPRLHFAVFTGNGSSVCVPVHCLLSAVFTHQFSGPPADPLTLLWRLH
jgi:hypothetical protein